MSLEPDGILEDVTPNRALSAVCDAHRRLCLISDPQSQFPFKVSFIHSTNIYSGPVDTSLWGGYRGHCIPVLEEPKFL